MAKVFLREIEPHKILYRDDRTGIAWIEDGCSGCRISIHPNIDANGSVRGMKKLGYWNKTDRTVRSHGWIYNIDRRAFSWDKDSPNHELEVIVAKECRCQSCIERREQYENHR